MAVISRNSTCWNVKPLKNRAMTATQPPQSFAALMSARLPRPRWHFSQWRAWKPEVRNRRRFSRIWKSALWTWPEVTSTTGRILAKPLNATAAFVVCNFLRRIYLVFERIDTWNWYRFLNTVYDTMIVRKLIKLCHARIDHFKPVWGDIQFCFDFNFVLCLKGVNFSEFN